MDEQKNLIEEINKIKNMFLLSLSEEQGYLKIKVCGSKFEDCEEEMVHEFNFKGMEHLLKGAQKVLEDKSIIYEITFDSYVAYSTRWESYTTWDEEEEFSFGKNYRVFSKSKFLDYITNSTFASGVIEYNHYGVYCEWQIIDIASMNSPTITKYTLFK